MLSNNIKKKYFDWLYNMVCGNRFAKEISYRKLFSYLHNTEFIYSIPKDSNRAEDGVDLRYRFAYYHETPSTVETYLEGPCSVLEMMIALALRCEETIMDDPEFGDRTGQWFWGMINNLGLGAMTDTRFDIEYVEDVVDTFLYREYSPDGRGGLFRVRNCDTDLRTVEIWWQLCWYLNTIT